MSVSESIPFTSFRRDPDSDPFLDSSNRKGDDETALSGKTLSRKKRYFINSISCFGLELTPDSIAVAMVYFVQDVFALSRLAVSFYMKDDLHLDPAEVYHHYLGLSNPYMGSSVLSDDGEEVQSGSSLNQEVDLDDELMDDPDLESSGGDEFESAFHGTELGEGVEGDEE